jgi:hypothetical protein
MNVVFLLLTATAGPGADAAAVPTVPAPSEAVSAAPEAAVLPGLRGRLRACLCWGGKGCAEPACTSPGYSAPGVYERYAQWGAMPYTCARGFGPPGGCSPAPGAPLPVTVAAPSVPAAVAPPSPAADTTLPLPREAGAR